MKFIIIKRKFQKEISNIFTNKNDKILDLGCGGKPYYHRFIKGHLVCFDIRKSGKTHIIGDADFLPFKKSSFDKVIIVNALYYFNNPYDVMQNVSRLLKKDGKTVIITPFLYPIHDVPYDKYRFTEYGLKALLEDNFKI